MIKIMTIVGTRPELIKMSRVIAEFDNYTNHILVHTGQNHDYELNQIFFDDLNIRKPNYFLNVLGIDAIETIASVIKKSNEVIKIEKPDAIMLYGDTNSCLSVLAAKKNKIPTFHMEAGNRCFDQRVPEELNRKIVDHLSDINLVLTEHARRNLLAEGLRSETIIKTGSHMNEVLHYYMNDIDKSNILSRLNLIKNNYFLVSAHREENVDCVDNLKDLIDSLKALHALYNIPIVVSTHPRTRKRIEEKNYGSLNDEIIFMKPFGFFDYIKLQMNSLCVISDSGTITEEASILNLPAITIRNTHERPEGMDSGILIMSGLKKQSVLESVDIIIKQHKKNKFILSKITDYDIDSVSNKILRIVLSYTGYVNRNVWRI
jgi:UDP-N-acetylglucosamine 2-epimerase